MPQSVWYNVCAATTERLAARPVLIGSHPFPAKPPRDARLCDLRAALEAYRTRMAKGGYDTELDHRPNKKRNWLYAIEYWNCGCRQANIAGFGFPVELGEDTSGTFLTEAVGPVPAFDVLRELARIVGPLLVEEDVPEDTPELRTQLRAIFGPRYRHTPKQRTRPTFVLWPDSDLADVQDTQGF